MQLSSLLQVSEGRGTCFQPAMPASKALHLVLFSDVPQLLWLLVYGLVAPPARRLCRLMSGKPAPPSAQQLLHVVPQAST
jgi:hypothetical protein